MLPLLRTWLWLSVWLSCTVLPFSLLPQFLYRSPLQHDVLISLKVNQVVDKHVFNKQEPAVLHYLRSALRLAEEDLSKIVQNYPQILYLLVDTNLAPTIAVFKSFGFKPANIRKMVSAVPTVLCLDYRESVPRRLLALRQMFSLSRQDIVHIVSNIPYLLTSSIDRNQEIADFFLLKAKFSPEELRKLVRKNPTVLCLSLVTIERCYSLLNVNYCFTPEEIRNFVLKNPLVLSEHMLIDVDVRFRFFRRTVGLRRPPARDFYKFVSVNPYLLILPPIDRLARCFDILQDELQMNTQQTAKFVRSYPMILTYKPDTLENKCHELVQFLCEFANGDGFFLSEASNEMNNKDGENEEGMHALANSRRFLQSLQEKRARSSQSSDEIDIAEDDGDDPEDNKTATLLDGGELQDQDAYFSVEEVEKDKDELVNISTPLLGQLGDFDFLSDTVNYFDTVLASATSYLSPDQLLDDLYPGRKTSFGRHIRSNLIAENGSEQQPNINANFINADVFSPKPFITHVDAVSSPSKSDSSELMTFFYGLTANLNIAHDRCLRIIEHHPMLLGFNVDRFRLAVTAIAFSLGLTKEEIVKIVTIYPRVLMMSWDGKVTAFFEVMGKLTIRYLEIHGVPKEFGSGNTETQSFDSNMAKIMEWRSHPVRAMIRHLVLRNPLLFGTSVTRIEERSELFFRHGLEWNKLNFVIKRSPAQHTKWLEKNDNSSALLGKLLKKEYPVFTLDDLYGNDGNIFSSVNPFNKPNFLSELTPQLYNQVKELNARLDEEVQRDRKSTALLQLPQQAGASAGGDFLLQKIERLEKILDASLEPLPRLEQITILDNDSSSLSSIRKRRLHRKKKKNPAS